MKKSTVFIGSLLLFIFLVACSGADSAQPTVSNSESDVTTAVFTTDQETVSQQETAIEQETNTGQAGTETAVSVPATVQVEFDSEDLNETVADEDENIISLNGDSILFSGEGATVEGSIITINSAGTYSLSGTLNDGQIIVDSADAESVTLILNGVALSSSTSAPIYVVNAEKAIITLAEGSENTLSDATTYVYEDPTTDEPNGALFSDDDLTINGTGTLIVNGNFNHGIVGKDDLKITSGTIVVTAVNDGIKGRDSIAVLDGNITINAGGDGLQSNNDEDPEKGIVSIEGGTININAGEDGIQAETILSIADGSFTINSGVGSSSLEESSKGLKAAVHINITGGTFTINSVDDTIHSNDTIVIAGGTFALASSDDGVHADSSLVINGGTIDIANSYEGLESAIIIINDGNIHLVASDDGINVAGGADGSAVNGRPGQNTFTEGGTYYLEINGGYIYVDAGGDGLDANGSIAMTGGQVVVNGPTVDSEGPIDYDNTFTLTGGYLLAVGSARMAQSPGAETTQTSVLVTLPSTVEGGTPVRIEDSTGTSILTFVPLKAFQTVVLSSTELVLGETYTVYTGGEVTGTAVDGLYSESTYTGGTQVSTFTMTDIVTGESAGGFGGPGGARPGGGNRP